MRPPVATFSTIPLVLIDDQKLIAYRPLASLGTFHSCVLRCRMLGSMHSALNDRAWQYCATAVVSWSEERLGIARGLGLGVQRMRWGRAGAYGKYFQDHGSPVSFRGLALVCSGHTSDAFLGFRRPLAVVSTKKRSPLPLHQRPDGPRRLIPSRPLRRL